MKTVLVDLEDAPSVHIVVFGAGAMGSFFGGLLSSRHEVLLIGRVDHVRAVSEHGLRITGKTIRLVRPEAATKVPRGAKPDVVLLSTKAYDTESAMVHLRPFARSALFVTLQNGLDNADTIARSAERVVAGTTSHGVTFLGPGEIRHAGVGDTVIGPWKGVDEADLVRLRDVFDDVGIPARLTSDVRTELWAKVVLNASINPVSALAGVPNGRLVRDRRLREAVEVVCREAASVARAEGARIDPGEILHRTLLVARRTASNRSSMLQDLEAGRRTGIDAITGAIVAAAERRRLEVPVNGVLLSLVRARESAASRSA